MSQSVFPHAILPIMKLAIFLFVALGVVVRSAALIGNEFQLAPRADIPKDAAIIIDSFSLVGDGCPEKSSASIKYIDGATLTLIFDKFRAFSFPGNKELGVGCAITVNLINQAAYKSAQLRDKIRGSAILQANTTMYVLVDTEWNWQTSKYVAVSSII